MSADRFHQRPFDEGTLTKLEVFELYVGEWLPVFLAKSEPTWKEVHLFDFFAGPGKDSEGELGSPLRLLRQLKLGQQLHGWSRTRISAHFYDADASKIATLKQHVQEFSAHVPEVVLETEPWDFETAFKKARPILRNAGAAKLVLIDQFGVSQVSDEIFGELVSFPTCDFLFFLSTSTLYRFHEHPAIKQRIQRSDDYYHVHPAAMDYYRALLPASWPYFLGRFSIKKGSNIYGLIFGSRHPLGMDKFLQVAWKTDRLNGEADFDINRDDFRPLSKFLPPTKLAAFATDLKARILDRRISSEADVIELCFQHGVTRQHARPVLKELIEDGWIECEFTTPELKRFKEPKTIRLRDGPSAPRLFT